MSVALPESAEPGPAPAAPSSRRVVSNLVRLWLAGIALCGWVAYFTELLPLVGGLLGLGGVLAWLGFVGKLLPEERVKMLQQSFEQHCLASAPATVGSLALLLVAAGLWLCGRAVDVQAFGEPVDRLVAMAPDLVPFPEEQAALVPANGTVRFTTWAAPFSRRECWVRVKGYPGRRVILPSWGRVTLRVPASFQREVVLLKPGQHLASRTRGTQERLVVAIGATAHDVGALDGRSVVVGCADDVQFGELVPARKGAGGQGSALYLATEINAGDWLSVSLIGIENGQAKETALAQVEVRDYSQSRRFPQVEEIELP